MIDSPAAAALTSDAVLDRIVRCIREVAEPELVMLFGSRATGEARIDSDYDLLIVLPERTAGRPADEIRTKLAGIPVSADVLVRAPAEYLSNQRDPGLLDFMIAREGRVLFSAGRLPLNVADAGSVREPMPRKGLAMWIRRAESDLRNAEHSLSSTDPTWDAICFHSHACVEKLLKALIVLTGKFPPRTHDLEKLLAMQRAVISDDPAIVDGCKLLDALLPAARYPELPEPAPEQALDAIRAARYIRAVVAPLLAE
jgi:HEPN domain-containing protein/predicted nucleotidyltransferase